MSIYVIQKLIVISLSFIFSFITILYSNKVNQLVNVLYFNPIMEAVQYINCKFSNANLVCNLFKYFLYERAN